MKQITFGRIVLFALLCTAVSFLGTASYLDADGNARAVTIFRYYFLLHGKGASCVDMILAGVAGNWYSVLMPLFVSAPGLLRFADLEQSGCWRFCKTRQDAKQYTRRTYFNICGTGTAAVLLGYLIFTLFMLRYPAPVPFADEDGFVMETPITLNPLCRLLHSPVLLWWCVLRFAIVGLNAWLCTSFCYAVYLLTLNKYKAIGFPLILIYLLNNISMQLFLHHNWDTRFCILSPGDLIKSGETWFADAFGVSFWLLPLGFLVLISGMYLLTARLLKRREQR